MNTAAFVEELLSALAALETIQLTAVHSEGPIVNGRATLSEEVFLSFYYNQITGTQAFALIHGERRIWGIDYDNIRGWHLHPVELPESYLPIDPQSVTEIIQQLGEVLKSR